MAVVLTVFAAATVCTAGYLLVSRPRIRAYLLHPSTWRMVAALRAQDPGADVFTTIWDTNRGALLSRRLFREVDMDGVRKYAYQPNLRKLGFRAGAGGVFWAMETLDTPAIRSALSDVDTTWLAPASYDERGFRRVAPELTRDCERRVLFLGDSFTDGLWVADEQTFVNVYGELMRRRGGIRVCPVNAGVNGYGSFEERFVLEHRFDETGPPSVVFVMYFANDVDQDYLAVVDGRLPDADRLWRDSMTELRRMRRFASDRHATLVLCVIPPAEQAIEGRPKTYYQDVLRAFARDEGIMFIDLYESFAAGPTQALYWDWDPHLTPDGHRAVAEVLYEKTAELLR